MALNFPSNPVDGQLYPNPAVPGAQQYIYNSEKGTWLTVFKGVERVSANSPLFTTGSQNSPTINILPATPTEGGFMTAADKAKLDDLDPSGGTVKSVTAGTGLGAPASGDEITETGTIDLLPSNSLRLGGVKPGANVSVSTDGTLTVNNAGTVIPGAVKPGTGLVVGSDGSLSLGPNSTYKVLDNLSSSFNGSRTSFQMTVGGNPFSPPSASSLLVFVGGVIQVPFSSFNVIGGVNLEFTSAPPTGASFYGISLT